MTHLEERLKELRESLSQMAKKVKEQLRNSMEALYDKDLDLANEVVAREKRINGFELTIDRQCEQIFALLTPVAQDMRLVFSTLKINSDLERIGDYAEGIARLVLLGKKNFDDSLVQSLSIKKMADLTIRMIEDAIKAYCEDDSRYARTVFTMELEVNEINHNATDIVVEYCKKNTNKIQQALYLMSIVRKLERVGDHIENIAEDIIFYKEAKVLKHEGKK